MNIYSGILLTILQILTVLLILIMLNNNEFDEKYILKDKVVKNLLAYKQAEGEFNNRIIKDFNIFCINNYKVTRFLGLKFAKEIPVKGTNDFFDNIYVERRAIYDFLTIKKYERQ